MAAVSVVLPWSMWPIVPTLTCGLVRVKTFLAMGPPKKWLPRAAARPGHRVRGLGGVRRGTARTPGRLELFDPIRRAGVNGPWLHTIRRFDRHGAPRHYCGAYAVSTNNPEINGRAPHPSDSMKGMPAKTC